MMLRHKIFLAILFSAFVTTIYGQDKSDDVVLLKSVCNKIIENQIKEGVQVIYTDRISSWDWITNIINIQDTFGRQPKPIIILTKKDKASLLEQIKTLKKYQWQDSLFENSRRIEQDSIWVNIHRENKKRFSAISDATAQRDTTTINKLKHERTRIYTFSKPLYIREKSVALTGFGWMCGGDCGHNEVAFYKKVHGKWKRWAVISEGDF